MMLAYILLTQIVKSWLARRFEPEGSIAGG
jgi:hypothetical protein